jgi:hypothetical protein
MPIPAERPEVLWAVIETHRPDHGYTTDDLSRLSLLQRDGFERIYPTPQHGGPKSTPPTKRLRVVG